MISLPFRIAPLVITGVSTATPGVVTVAKHPLIAGDVIRIRNVLPDAGINQRGTVATSPAEDTFAFAEGYDYNDTYSSGGIVELLPRPSDEAQHSGEPGVLGVVKAHAKKWFPGSRSALGETIRLAGLRHRGLPFTETVVGHNGMFIVQADADPTALNKEVIWNIYGRPGPNSEWIFLKTIDENTASWVNATTFYWNSLDVSVWPEMRIDPVGTTSSTNASMAWLVLAGHD